MASPQLEHGYTKIANEIYEAFARIIIPGEARRVLDVIIRKTYGFNKRFDRIALSQFYQATGLKTSKICRALKKLVAMNLILIRSEYSCNSYSLNKDYDTWKASCVLPVRGTPRIGNQLLPRRGIRVLPVRGDTKERYTKETITKEKNMQNRKKIKKLGDRMTAQESNDSNRILDAFEPVNTHAHILHESTKQFEAAMRLAEFHGVDMVLKVIKVLPKTNDIEFFPRIYTPAQLEEKWESLHHAWKDAVRKKIKNTPKIIL